ncbi:MAG: DUF4340 domain-containing protein [Anaerolineae bacterium]
MTKLQRILAIVLVGQLVLAAIVFWPRGTVQAESGPLFPGLETADIVKLTVADNTGNQITLLRKDDGWVLADSGDFPVDGSKIEPVLDKIAALQTGRLVAQNATSYKRLQVADNDFLRRVDMELQDGTVQTLYIGSSPSSGATHVRRADQKEAYLVSDLASWEVAATAQNWIDSTYVNLNREDVTRLNLENSNGSFQFDKQDDGTWTMVGLTGDETLNMTNFNAVFNPAVGLRMNAPLGLEEKPEYGLDEPAARLTFTTTNSDDGSTATAVLRIGAQLPDGSYAANGLNHPTTSACPPPVYKT